jgi:hypothetical protein
MTADERLGQEPTSPPVVSVVNGNNAELISEVSRLYIADGDVVADVTFGLGAFWRSTDTSRFTLLASDLAADRSDLGGLQGSFVQADFARLPYGSGSIDTVVLDPPYIHSPGRHQTDRRYNNAATTKGFYYSDILDLYVRGFQEAHRVLRAGGFLWVKCMDQVMSGRQQWAHVDLHRAATELGFYGRDLFVLVPTSRTSKNRWTTQHHARKVHSYLWVFQKGTPTRSKSPRRAR